MSIQIKVDFQGVHRAVARVNRGYSTEAVVEWARSQAHGIARNIFGQNFTSEGRRLGKKWQPLATRTREDRRRLGYGEAGPILVRKGSLKSKVLNSLPSIHARATEVSVIWGEIDDVKYLANQAGSRNNLPARRMIGANKTDAQTFTRSLRSTMIRRMANV